MEENFERDYRKGKAKVEDTDQDSLPPQSNRNKEDEYYYVKLFGQLTCKDVDGPDSLEGVTRKIFIARNKDIATFFKNEDEKLKIIHRDSGATIGIASDSLSKIHRHSYLELLGTVDQVKIAEILMTDAINEMYQKPFIPKALMPTTVLHHGMIVPLLKVSPLLGLYGNNLEKLEVKTGTWIELEEIEASSDEQSWVRRANIFGSCEQITNALDVINRGVSEVPVIPEAIWDTIRPEDIWEWDTFVEETAHNDSVEEAAAIEDEGSDQVGNGKERVAEKETAHNDSVEEAAAIEDSGSDQVGRVPEKEASSSNPNSNML